MKRQKNELEADFVLFNTCAIRENAEERVYGELGRFNQFKKRKPNMIIGICGCMPQEEKTIITIKKKFPQINIVFGTHNIASLPEYLYDAIMNQKKVIDVLSVEGDIYENIPMVREHQKKKLGLILCMVAMNFAHIVLYHTQEEKKDRVDPKILSTR